MSDKSLLAVNGGPKTIPFPLPDRGIIGVEEKAAVDALFDKCIAEGSMISYNGVEEDAFRLEFAAFHGGGFAEGVNSGTNAIYVALKALELPPFSEVVVGCVTDPGGMMPIAELSCIPVPADTVPGSYNTGPEEIEARITERTSAIVVAHLCGEPADMPGIMKVAKKYNLPVVEDCAQTHLGLINGQHCGTFGDIACFSLMYGKHICTGGQGGVVFTRNEDLFWKIRRAHDRGKPFNLKGRTNLHTALNCNMDELHAAIGRVQLKKLPYCVERRIKFVEIMNELGLDEVESIYQPQKDLPEGFVSCCWQWRLRVLLDKVTCDRNEYCAALAAEGVPLSPTYPSLPVRQEWYYERGDRHPWNNPLYKGNAHEKYPLPNMDKVMDSDFCILNAESFGEKEASLILEAMKKVDRAFRK